MPKINGKEVGPIGFGLMGFTWRAQPCSLDQAFEAMRASLDAGCNFWNGGEFYGTPEYNSMTLLAKYFEKYPEDAEKVVLSMKGGMNMAIMKPDASPEGVRRSMDNMLAQLKGRKVIDLFECARRDPEVPLSETFGALAREYIEAGKLGGVSLSECSAATIHEAAKVRKVGMVEVELSLWATDVLENGVAAACAQYDIPLVAYSPLGHGILTGQVKCLEDIPEGDFRRVLPRFQPDTFDINLELVRQVESIAARKGCTPGQLAIGWCIALSRRPGMPTIIPIPGATTAERVRENATLVEVTDAEMAEIDSVLKKFPVVGGRYPAGYAVET